MGYASHEGITKVWKIRIVRFCTKYVSFNMKNGESLRYMIKRFVTLINELMS